MHTAALTLDDVTLGYNRRPAVHHLSGQFAPGSLTAVVGPNGAGKSTLLRALAGYMTPLDGQITRVAHTARDIAFLPQVADIDRRFPITIGQLAAMGGWRGLSWLGLPQRGLRQRVEQALSAVGLDGFYHRPLGHASVGQVQRALFARVMVQDAPLVLLDEPFAALDTATVSRLVERLHHWQGEGRTVIAVVHDLDLVRHAFPQALLLARHPIAWGGASQVLRAENLLAARRMTEDWDHAASVCA